MLENMFKFWKTIHSGHDHLWQRYIYYRTVKHIGIMASLIIRLNHVFIFSGSFTLSMQQLAKQISFLHTYLYLWINLSYNVYDLIVVKLEFKNNLTHMQYVSYNTWKCRKTVFWREILAGSEILIAPTRFQSASACSMKNECTHRVWGLS